jgi:multicomponent Na+:H+ antiporter subunit E
MRYLPLTLFLALVFLLLTGNRDPGTIILALIGGFVIGRTTHPGIGLLDWRNLPAILAASVRYIVRQLRDLFMSGIQVARLVWRPDQLRPGVLAISSNFSDAKGVALSAHAITMTPGTVVMELDREGVMYTHCLDINDAGEIAEDAQAVRHDTLEVIFSANRRPARSKQRKG